MTGDRPRVFTIAPGVPFVDALAAGIAARVGDDPLALAGVTVLLPTRRAARSLREAFLRRSGGRPTLLPRMSPLGDVDADALSLAGEEVPAVAAAVDLPDAIGGLRRQLLLARLILHRDDITTTTGQAVRLAADLGRFLDAVATERTSFDKLAGLVPEDHAEHWQVTVRFLAILTEHWPGILAGLGLTDPAHRRNAVLAAQAELWRTQPPDGLVVAAGSTGSIPATADLLAVIAGLPNGAVVLPGLDTMADDDQWAAIASEESHPQFGMARLLRRIGAERADVTTWSGGTPGRSQRTRIVAEAMRPAATTDRWRDLDGIDERALEGIARIDAATPEEEAAAIALLMRHALVTPERTAALVTPDRTLARRVAMALRRWGVEVDDSAGRPLRDTAVGSYLRLVAGLVAERAHPLALLALAKHPLAAGGQDPSGFRGMARALERIALRGPRPPQGFAGLRAALAAATDREFEHPGQRDALAGWLDGIARLAAPFAALMAGGPAPLDALLDAHARLAENLAADGSLPGAARLWRHDDGEEAARFIAEALEAAPGFPPVPGTDYPALFEALMGGRAVRPRYGLHPRLAILGPLEARLQQFDLMILGGLNEGTWPAEPSADPWLSRPMRRAFGLPGPERQIGLAAHDVAQALGAERVVLTRAERVDGTPTVPSRWLLRLDTVLRGHGLHDRLTRSGALWMAWARALDRPERVQPVRAPEPRPPVEARPRQLSVTEIETWMRDPYAIYARHVLRLTALEPIAADPGAAERGTFIHAALDAFVRAYPGPLPADALGALLACGRAAFGPLLDSEPEVWAFWWPRFERIAAWVVAVERERRRTAAPQATEVKGRLELAGPGGPFTLTAKADRIDRVTDATGAAALAVIDYKTGVVPSERDIDLGLAPQLPLEAAIAAAGGFVGVPAGPVVELAFWQLSGGDPPGRARPVKGDLDERGRAARLGLEALIRAFDDTATPYRSCPRPAMAPRFTDYAHLARVQEWSAGGGGEE